MPSYAYLKTELQCPHCTKVLADMEAFQWGYSPGQDLWPEHVYRLGDAIQWRACASGVVLSWVSFRLAGPPSAGNIGDPAIRSLDIRIAKAYYQDRPVGLIACDACGQKLAGATIEVRAGVLAHARVLTLEEGASSEADYSIVGDDNSRIPSPLWDDHPMILKDDC
jgi:hypothetical protein